MSRALAFDTETRGLRWDAGEDAFLVTWADATQEFHEDLTDRRVPYGHRRFTQALWALEPGDRIWGHNLKFDLHQYRASTGFDVLDYCEAHGIELWDTHSLDQVLNPEGQRKGRGGHGLKALDELYLEGKAGANDAKLEELAKELEISLRSTPEAYYLIYQAYSAEMIQYARQDARSTYDLGENIFLPQLAAAPENLQRVVQLERDVMPVIYLAERRGVATDQDQVRAFKRQYDALELDLRSRLEHELGGHPADDSEYGSDPDDLLILDGKGSTASLREALLKAGVPLVDRSDNGQLRTDRATLAPLTSDFPVVDDLLEWRRVRRFLNTYIEPMIGREVIHTDYQQQEAWTGRMSGRRPNMQNWPQRAGKEVRNVLTARPGHKLIVADFAQMEAMIIVRYLNHKPLIDAIEGGLDMNSWMAASIWGGEVEDWAKSGPKAEGEQSRKTARHTLYATLYGAGGGRVTQQLPFLNRGPYYAYDDAGTLRNTATGTPIPQHEWKGEPWPRPGWQYAEAKALIRKVKQALPGYGAFTKRLDAKIERYGYVNTYYGRQNPVSRDKKYVAVAAIVQGTGADVLKLAAVRARRMLEPFGATVTMFTHDELVAEVLEENAEPALAALVEAMEGAAPDHVPHFRASGHIVTHYGQD